MTAPWHLPPDLRPTEQPEAMSIDAKLIAAKVALAIVAAAIDQSHSRVTGKRWSQRERLEYIRAVCNNVLRRIK